MSYKALYRKYRPTSFEDVQGQEHIVKTLENIIGSKKIGHAYLFAGPRGTGKTSVANVFAREVNRNASGRVVSNEMDIIEIDAASNNGVAEIRQLIDNSKYAPSESKYKVYIIDEVHMLSKSAFNALLKTLEEPPQHVIFILATTEPHKIPVTILSRTQRFNFRRIDNDTIKAQLKKVLTNEGIEFDSEAIRFIARLSQGGMRDALSIADQAAAFGNNQISFLAISQVFGIVSIENQIKLLNYAYNGEAKSLLVLISKFFESGADVERLTLSLVDTLKDFIIYSKTKDKSLLSTLQVEEIERIRISVKYAYESLDVIVKLLSDLRYSLVPRQSFELALLKISKTANTEAILEKPKEIFVEKVEEEKSEYGIMLVDETEPESILDEIKEESVIETEPESILDEIKEEPVIETKPEPGYAAIERQQIELRYQKLKGQRGDSKVEDAPVEEVIEDIIEDKVVEEKVKETTTTISLEEDKKDISLESVFETQETMLEPNPEKIIMGTDEIEATSEILLESQEATQTMSKVEEDIISTQEIPLGEINSAEGNTEDIDLLSSFKIPETELETTVPTESYTTSEIINLLNIFDKGISEKVKEQLSMASHFADDTKSKTYSELLLNTKVIAAGMGYALVASKDKDVIKSIRDDRKKNSFLIFTEKVFGKPTYIYAISKEEFEEARAEWIELRKAGKLPEKKQIELPVIDKKVSKEEEYGKGIFGDLFK